jgi:hypothetical protein
LPSTTAHIRRGHRTSSRHPQKPHRLDEPKTADNDRNPGSSAAGGQTGQEQQGGQGDEDQFDGERGMQAEVVVGEAAEQVGGGDDEQALLAAGTAGIQAALTALGAGPAGIITSMAALLTTAITVLGPKLIDLRGEQQFGKELRWLIEHNQGPTSTLEIATQLKEYHEHVLQARMAAIKAAHTETKERKTRNSRRSSTSAS